MCQNGYKKNRQLKKCEDIDECDNHDIRFGVCDRKKCVNTPGSFYCEPIKCPKGFEADSEKKCADVNECREFPCPYGETCQNTIGSFVCLAPTTTSTTTLPPTTVGYELYM